VYKAKEIKSMTTGMNVTIGRPKSKKPWNQKSERSNMNKPHNPTTWKQKMETKRKLKVVKERINELKEAKKGDVINIEVLLTFWSIA
jgi:hypothetical protein